MPRPAAATAPFFVGPDGVTPVDTNVVHQAIVDAATVLGLDAANFGSSACRRGGATDLRDRLGSAAGKQLIVQRGRWCHTDIDEIYSRASLGEHVAASVALGVPEEEALQPHHVLAGPHRSAAAVLRAMRAFAAVAHARGVGPAWDA